MKGSIFRHPTPLPLGVSSGYVMTVLGPLPISEMGVTLMHEHILLDASGKWVPPCCCSDRHLAEMPVKMENLGELSLNPLMSRDNCQLFDVDVAIEELTKYRALGGETVVDPTNIGIGRDPNALARIARLTGLNVIMGTGLYLEPSHPEWGRTSSVEQLTERLIYDLGGAEEKPDVLAGLIGEIGISSRFTPDEEKSLRAAGRASAATGVPLVLHGGTGVSDEDMRLAVTEGINKVNVGTEMNVQWVDQCKSTFEKGKVNDSVRKFLIPANNAVTHVLMEKIALFK